MLISNLFELTFALSLLAQAATAVPTGGKGGQESSNFPYDLNEVWLPSASSPVRELDEHVHHYDPEDFVDYSTSFHPTFSGHSGGEGSSTVNQGDENQIQDKNLRTAKYWEHRNEAQQWSQRQWSSLNSDEIKQVAKIRQALHNHIKHAIRSGLERGKEDPFMVETYQVLHDLPCKRMTWQKSNYEEPTDPISRRNWIRAMRHKQKKEALESGVTSEDPVFNRGKGRPRLPTEGLTKTQISVRESKRKYTNKIYAQSKA